MGQAQGKNKEAEFEFIFKQTGIDRASLEEWYQSLVSKKKLTKKDFVAAYRQFFPEYVRKRLMLFVFVHFFVATNFSAILVDQVAEMIFKRLDSNSDGTISVTEFAITIYFLTKAPVEDKLRHIFKLLDFDGSGFLSSKEVIQVIKYTYDMQGQLNIDYDAKGMAIFNKMDKDGDCKINVEEFLEACQSDSELTQLFENMFNPMKKDQQ